MGEYTRYEHNVTKCSIYCDMWKQYNVRSNNEIMWNRIKDVKSRKDIRKRFYIKDLIINNDRVLQKNYQRTSINL